MATPVQQGQPQPLDFLRAKISGTDGYRAALFQALVPYPYLVFRSGNILVNGEHLQAAMAAVQEASGNTLLGGVQVEGLPPEAGILLPGGASSSFFREVVTPTGSLAQFLLQTTGLMFFTLTQPDGAILYTVTLATNPPSMPPIEVLVQGRPTASARHGLLEVLTEKFSPAYAPAHGPLQV